MWVRLRLLSMVTIVGVICVGVRVVPVAAQSAVATQDVSIQAGIPVEPVNYFDFFVVKGGVIAFGLIALSMVTVALALEHFVSIRRATIVPRESTERAQELIAERKYLDAIQFTANDPSMTGSVVHAGLREAPNGYVSMERAIEEMLDERSSRLFRKIEYLNIIGNVAPMIGLLGTVTGMILLFAEIHAADAFPGARVVADRIAVALITTFWGLAVAIPALSIYGYFRNRIDGLTAECALATERILSVFKPGATTAQQPPTANEAAVGGSQPALPAAASAGK